MVLYCHIARYGMYCTLNASQVQQANWTTNQLSSWIPSIFPSVHMLTKHQQRKLDQKSSVWMRTSNRPFNIVQTKPLVTGWGLWSGSKDIMYQNAEVQTPPKVSVVGLFFSSECWVHSALQNSYEGKTNEIETPSVGIWTNNPSILCIQWLR